LSLGLLFLTNKLLSEIQLRRGINRIVIRVKDRECNQMNLTEKAKRTTLYTVTGILTCTVTGSIWAIRTEAEKARVFTSVTPISVKSKSASAKGAQKGKAGRSEGTLNGGRPKSESQSVFERRILPIFNSPTPSSCTTCHLAGVDLKDYILPSHQKTFLSLRDQGLIDLDKPANSKILRLIAMGADQKEGAALITSKMQKMEYEAFRDWIVASCREPQLRRAAKLKTADLAQPTRPVEVIRHARKDHVLESFTKHVWSQESRCSGCHMSGGAENAKKVAEFGEKVNWIRPEGPEATMRFIVENGLIDTQRPERSLLLLKPLNEVKHGGGQKMMLGDLGYKAFRSWIEDYAKIVNNRYQSAADLPATVSGKAKDVKVFGTEIWLKLNNTPPEWADRLLQVTVRAWDTQENRWEDDPIAISDRRVAGKVSVWQHSLMLLARKGSARAMAWTQEKATLSAGRYLLKVHVDRAERLQKDWTASFGEEEYAGQAEIESRWSEGYGKMTVIEASQMRR